MRHALAVVLLAAAAHRGLGQVSVPMSQYNFDRTGANLGEVVLNTSNIDPAHFGKLFTRTVDDSVYGLPLIIPNLTIAGGVHDVLFVATMNNSVYAFDAADPARTQPYWSVNLGNPGVGDSWIGPIHFGILSTPFIDTATNTMYVVAEVQNGTDVGLYINALDITTGQLKYNSPRRMSFQFPIEGVTLSNVNGALQRAGLLVSNGVLYVATANIVPNDHLSQEGFVQSFDAHDLTNQIGTFQATPSATEGKGGIWEAGRGLSVDASGVYFSIAGGAYSSTASPQNFGSSIVKVAPGTLNVQDWFAPQNWQYLFDNNVDPAAGGVTLIPGTSLLFAGGKEGVIYLLNRSNMGHLEGTDGQAVQRFQAGYGCAQNIVAPDCAQSLGTAYWDRGSDGMLYVWDKTGVLRAYHFNGQTFDAANPQVGTLSIGMTGGPSVSANGADLSSAIVWAVTTANSDSGTPSPGTLRAFRADNVAQELYNSDINHPADSLGTMTKFASPVVANGKVYVATQSNAVQVYGPLPANGDTTVTSQPVGLSLTVDSVACVTPCVFRWSSGSNHTIAASTQAGTAGTQYLFNAWSDSGAASHVIDIPSTATTYTASFTTQYLLTTAAAPGGSGSIAANPASAGGYYDSGSVVQLTASPSGSNTFTGWSGNLSGSVNPQSVTMSAARTVTANFQAPAGASSSFVTGFALNSPTLRNNFSGWVGMKLTVGATPLTVTALGRIFLTGNTGTHTVKLVQASNGVDVAGGSVSIAMAGGSAGQFRYVSLGSPIILQANTAYYLVTQELSGGDAWYDYGTIAATSVATVNNSVWLSSGSTWNPVSGSNSSYVPPNFQYTLPAVNPDLTITKSHSGNFTQGDAGKTYTITVTNSGGAPTNATVSVNDSVPVGLTATSISGTGWVCTQPAGPCTRSDALAAGGSYPPITLTVSVASNAPSSVVNTATVSGGGEITTSNDTAADPTTIQPSATPNQVVQSYALNSYARYLDGQWEGIRYASDGNVYFASSSQSAHHGAAFFRYNPATQQLTLLAEDITTVVGEDPLTNPQGKIHSDILEMHGWIFFTTHFGADDRPNGIAGWSGAHLVGYRISDTGSNNYFNTPVGSFHDYGVILPGSPGYDCYSAIAVDPVQNYIYVFATGEAPSQVSYVFRYNAATDTQATRVSLGQVYGSFAASLYWFTDSTGDVWFAIYNDNGALRRIHHDTQVIDRYDNVLPPFIRQDSNTADASFDRSIQWMAPISGTKAVFTYNAGGMLYQFDSSQATSNSVPASAFTALKWIGPSYIGSALGANRVFYYQRASGAVGHQGCDGSDTLLPPTCQDYHLKSVSLDPGYAIADHGLIIDQSGRTVWRVPAMMTDGTNNNVYLVGDWWTYDTSGNPVPGDHGVNNTLRYHYSQGAEFYVDEPRGEFFAVAHVGTGSSLPVITQQAQNATVTAGQTATFSVTASGGILTYQWQSKASGGAVFANIAGATGSSYTTPATQVSDSGTQFLCVVSNGSGPVSSNAVTLTVQLPPPPVITQQPQSATVIAGQTATFSVTASGGVLTYQWQSKAPGGATFANIAGATSSSYTTPATQVSDSGTQFLCVVSNSSGPSPSSAAILTVQAPGSATNFVTSKVLGTVRNNYSGWVGMAIRVGASPVTVNALGRIVVSGNSATHTLKLVNGTTGADVPGGTATVATAGGTAGSFVYGNLASPVTLNANGVYYLLTLETFGADQWYDYDSSVQSTTVAAVTSAVYGGGPPYVTIGAAGRSYAPLDFQYGGTGGSSSVVIVQQPQDVTVTAGQTATFTVNATGSAVSYQWQSMPAGGSVFVNINGATANSYTTLATLLTDSGTQFRCVVSNVNGAVNSNAVTLTVLPAATGTAFVTSTPGGSVRNNFTGWVGMRITVGPAALSVSAIGRICIAGNDGTHAVKFVRVSDGADVGLTSVNMSGCSPGQFQYNTLASSITLLASTSYYVVSQEQAGGDQWYDHGPLSSTSVATVDSSIYFDGASWIALDNANTSYVPSNFRYSVIAPPPPSPGSPFVTGYNLNNRPLRNDFTGWVGMKLTIGATPVTVSALGRIFVAGNSGVHTVKLVKASDGGDVAGGSVSLSMTGGTAGQFSYVTLASSITLQANTSYYLVSQETQGGDQWYDFGSVSTTSAGVVDNAVWWSGTSWMAAGAGTVSYVPPNFK